MWPNYSFLIKLIVQILLLVCVINVVLSLTLEGLATKKPRQGKFTLKPTEATSPPSTSSTYRLNNTAGNACILIQTDGLLSIQYHGTVEKNPEADVYLPDYPGLSGVCDNSDESSITLTFKGFTLTLSFEKTPGGERWFMNNVELTYSSSNPIFEHIDRKNLDVKLTNSSLLFSTPVGKSFTCNQEQTIILYSQDPNDKSGHLAKLYLRETRMQGFMYKSTNQWGPPYECSLTGTYRDETAPIAVGSTLALAVVATVTGYGIWRHLKVKKFQYGNVQ